MFTRSRSLEVSALQATKKAPLSLRCVMNVDAQGVPPYRSTRHRRLALPRRFPSKLTSRHVLPRSSPFRRGEYPAMSKDTAAEGEKEEAKKQERRRWTSWW